MLKLITSQQNVRYRSGFTGSVGILVIDGPKKTLIVDGRYTSQARAEVIKGIKVIQAPLNKSLVDTAIGLLKGKKHLKIGFEDDKVDVASFNELKSKLPGAQFVSISKEMRDARAIKNRDELALIRKAALIADVTFDCVVRMIRPGISEKDIAAEIDYLIRIMGADLFAFETLVSSGANSAFPHGKPKAKVLKPGDIVVMDFGARYRGYNGDMTRMVSLGVPSSRQRRIYNAVLKAQLAAIAKVKAGIHANLVDKVAREVLKREKLDGYFTHSTGHGIGLAVHEGPRISSSSADILKEGMVLTVEPGVYIRGFGGFRIEDMVLVTKKGCEVLTKSPKDLIVI